MPDFAIAIHGGAGVIHKKIPAARQQEYLEVLNNILRAGCQALDAGAPALDVTEAVVRLLEDDPKFNAGKGAVYTVEGTHELEASIMDGQTLRNGAVAGLRTIKSPIGLARLVLERSEHHFLANQGAEAFAAKMGVEQVAKNFFDTEHRFAQLQTYLNKQQAAVADFQVNLVVEDEDIADAANDAGEQGTVGCVARDRDGNLAAATSTGGRTGKQCGRIGDTPINGAGNYANNKSCAVSGTGNGEAFITHCVARDVAALMEYGGMSVREAADEVVFNRLEKGDGGVIAVGKDGELALPFNSTGMFRGAADGGGRFEVGIWEWA